MRVVKEWNEKDIRVTMFHMNGRFSIKLEKNLLEQTYKFRDGAFENPEQLKTALPDHFFEKSRQLFNEMTKNKSEINLPGDDTLEFDLII